MDRIRWAWTPLFAILLASCGIPGFRPPEPVRELPPTFNGVVSGDNSSQVGIHEFFSDPILTRLLEEGMYGNLELKILGEQIQIANNEVLKRRGAYLPFLTIGGSAGLEKPSVFTPAGAVDDQLTYPAGGNSFRTFPNPLPDFLGAVDLSWQIDIWRQLRNARDAASLRYLATTEGRNYVITRFVAEIAENYYGLMALDKRIETLNRTIALQEQSLGMAQSQKEAAQGTELGVQRFRAEVRKNQSQIQIVNQEIIEVENKINFLLGRFPQPVERSSEFFDLQLHALSLGVPAELLQNRPDIRQAERELEAAGLDVLVARANFFPRLSISAEVGYEAFNARYLFRSPGSLIYSVAGNIVAPLVNKLAIKADYMTANAKQLQAIYDYQRTVLEAFTEVINRVAKVQNYGRSIELKKEQLASLEASVDIATKLFNATRIEYIDVLFAQRDYNEARLVLIDTKREQLAAIVNTYQALGGGLIPFQYAGMVNVDGTTMPMVFPDPVPQGSPAPALLPPPLNVPAPIAAPDDNPAQAPPANDNADPNQ